MTPHPPIPNRFIFVWDDNFLPYTAYLAIRAVAQRAEPESITLLKTPELDGVPNFERLRREIPCLVPININLPAWLEESQLPCQQELLAANDFLKAGNYYASVSDLLRALYLYLHGGIYLDTDTLTLRPFTPLLGQGGFLAEEHILVDSKTWLENSPLRYFRTSPLTLARKVCSEASWGVPAFQAISPLYRRAVHNATMGFRARHPLMRDALTRMSNRFHLVPKRRPILGPDALQDLIVENQYEELAILPPQHFSPLGPTMTYQYFHHRSPKALTSLERRIVGDDTYAIHWSNNGTLAKAVPKNDAELLNLSRSQLFSSMAARAVFPGGVPYSE